MSVTKSSEQADRPRTIRPKLSHSHTVDVVIVASPSGYVMRSGRPCAPFSARDRGGSGAFEHAVPAAERAANLDRSAHFRSCVPSFDERNEVV